MFKILIKDMDSFEINKIIASILLTALIVIGIGKLADILFYNEKPKVSAYKVEGVGESLVKEQLTEETKVVEAVDIKALLAMGDMAHGEKVFKKCTACHMIAADGKNKIGPNLWGVIGRKAGSISDYKYSKAMVAYAKEWTFEEMNSYLIKPQAYIKGTKMAFAGLRKEKDRASVILYMNSKSASPKAAIMFKHQLIILFCA
jgi:cytochrome c